MVKRLFIKVEDSKVVIGVKHFYRFLKRLPVWLKLCWTTEDWDYEGIYDYIEMQLQAMLRAQEADTWHVPEETRKQIKQIKIVMEHLRRYRDPFKYYDFPEIRTVKSGNKFQGEDTYKTEFIDKEHGEERFNKFIKLENKHFNKFWDLLKKWHTGWWT